MPAGHSHDHHDHSAECECELDADASAANCILPGLQAVPVQSSPTDLLTQAIKTSNAEAVRSMLMQFPEAVHGIDTQDGATPLHWAALFGHLEIVQLLNEQRAALNVSIESSGMQPLHWASTRGHTEVVRYLLKHGCDINAIDRKQTTPLVIAAQYDHSVLVFFLVKEGADISRLDDCSDSALHWAAYKGNLQTAALLHYLGLPANAADSYGSTPLHLAAARNAPHVIEYLLDESTSSLEELVSAKDDKGRTPLEVARERGHPLAVRLLTQATPTLRTRLIKTFTGSDGSKVLLYFYLGNSMLTYVVYALTIAPAVGSVAQHYVYTVVNVLMQIAYMRIHWSEPGRVDMGPKGRQAYEDALQSAADGAIAESQSMPLCHTCRIVKPLRSKHCSQVKRCVPMFDHYCPYIGNTIGGANYVYFVAFIFVGMLGVVMSFFGTVQYLLFESVRSALVWFMAIDLAGVCMMALLMNQYHFTLILRNLTTNEDINKERYAYLRDDLNRYRNPFSRGPCGNMREFIERRAIVTANPYFHSEMYHGEGMCPAADVEMAEVASTSGDSEHDRLAP